MRAKNGFTLVELSIVLIIIGLLIGGILVAQSMIATAKLQSLIRQIGQFDAALENFQTKYNQLPGDNNLMGVSLGNNDKAIRSTAFCHWTGENGKYWADLSKSGLINPNGGAAYTDDSASATTIDTNTAQKLPTAAAGTKAYFMAMGYFGQNWYVIAQPYARGGVGSEVGLRMAFKPVDVLALDQKMDDGRPGAGNVTGNDSYDTPGYLCQGATLVRGFNNPPGVIGNCTNGALNATITGTSYQTAQSTDECFLVVRLGGVTGNAR